MSSSDRVLAWAEHGESFTVTEAQRALGLNKATLSVALRELADQGHITSIVISKRPRKGASGVVYRATSADVKAKLLNLVLFGGAGRKA